MRLSQAFIDNAEKRYGWANSEVDYTPHKVRIPAGTQMNILTDTDGNLFVMQMVL